MPLQEIRLPVILVLAVLGAALGIVVLNDKIKKKYSKWELLIGIAVAAGAVAVGFTSEQGAQWNIPLAIVAITLLVLLVGLRKVIWVFLKAALTGRRLPQIIWKQKDGSIRMKCPRCSACVQFTVGPTGDSAFQCNNCGEKITWSEKGDVTDLHKSP
jgi:hypothetical protein